MRKKFLSLTLLLSSCFLASCELIEGWPNNINIPTGQGGGGAAPVPPSAPAPSLVIENGSLAGFTVHAPEARMNDPRAGLPSYVYLQIRKDAVALPGPTIDDASYSLYFLDAPSITTERNYLPRGMKVRVNSRLEYVVDINDFEGEVSLARVELRKVAGGETGDTIETRFIFAARGEGVGPGVAHAIQIRAVVDGVSGRATRPVAIEAR
jgi:hypothetical protein